MRLNEAIQIARQMLAGESVTTERRRAAYDVLADFHVLLEKLENVMRGAN